MEVQDRGITPLARIPVVLLQRQMDSWKRNVLLFFYATDDMAQRCRTRDDEGDVV